MRTTGHEATGPYFFVDKYLAGEREVVEEWGMPGFLPVLAWLQEDVIEVPCVKLQ
jgi:hypothetical protein